MAGPATGTLFTDPGTIPKVAQQLGEYTILAEGALKELIDSVGARFFDYTFTEDLTVAGATATTTQKIPAGTCLVIIGITVLTTLSGNSVANYDVGVTGSATLFTSNYTGITADDTLAIAGLMTAALNAADVGILITPDQTTTAGQLRISVRCIGVRPPTPA